MSGRTPEEGRYSKITRRVWDDAKFRALSAPKPNAQSLWLRLLCGPELGVVPGLYAVREGGLADALGWPVAAFRKCWKEIADQEMAEADWAAGLVWVPNAICHNEPTSPNTVAAWRKAANQLPECALRAKALLALAEYLTEMGPTWIGAWGLADGVGWRPAKITPEVRDLVRKRDGDDCRYCGVTANWSDRKGPTGATYDHVDPTGPASPENIVVCCRSCNSRKGFRTPEMAGMALAIRSNRLPEPNPDKSGTDLGNGPVRIQIPITIQEQDSGAGHKKQEAEEPTAPTLEQEDPSKIRMHADWVPNAETIEAIKMVPVPEWAITSLVGRFRIYFINAPNVRRTEAEWNQRCGRWVLDDWRDPKKRPEKPIAPAAVTSSDERRKREAELLERAALANKRILRAVQ